MTFFPREYVKRRRCRDIAKRYKLVYHFKNGESWGEDTQEYVLTLDQIAFILKEQQTSSNMEMRQVSTGETKKVSEIKSMELIF